MSLRTRLLVGMALVAAVLVIVSAVLTITTRDELIGQIDARDCQRSRHPSTDRPAEMAGRFGEPPGHPPATSRSAAATPSRGTSTPTATS